MKKITDKQIALFCGFLSLILITIIGFLIFNRTDYDCVDFKTQTEAQKKFAENKKDIFNLDSDVNGLACDNYFKRLKVTPTPTPVKDIHVIITTPTPLPISEQAATAGQSAQISPTQAPNNQQATPTPPGGIHIDLPLPTIKLPKLINPVF